jgi:hypothetical protein
MTNDTSKSAFPFVDEVRRDVCRTFNLHESFAPQLPTPEKIIAAINVHAHNQIQHFVRVFNHTVQTKLFDNSAFEAEQQKLVDLAGSTISEAFEEAAFSIAMRKDDPAQQEDLYRNFLHELVDDVLNPGQMDVEQTTKAFHAPLIEELRHSLDEYHTSKVRGHLRLIHSRKNGNGKKGPQNG